MPFPFFRSKSDKPSKNSTAESPLTRLGTSHPGKAFNRMLRHDSGPSLEVYSRMREDPQIAAGLAVIKLPVVAAAYSVVAESQMVREFLEDVFARHWRRLMGLLLGALDYGFCALEMVYDFDYQQRLTISQLRDPDPTTLTIITDEEGSANGFAQTPDVVVPVERSLIFTHRGEHGNHYGISRLRPAYAAWRAKEFIFLYTNRYFERRGSPIALVKYPPNPQVASDGRVSPDTNADRALALGEALQSNAVVAIPRLRDATGQEQWEVSLLEDSARSAGFIEYMQYLDKLILRALFVPERTLTQDGTSGSFALARAHQDAFLLGLDGLIADLEEVINRKVVEPLVQLNFGAAERRPGGRVSIERLSRSRREMVAELASEMLASGNMRLDPRQVAELLDLPIMTEKASVSHQE